MNIAVKKNPLRSVYIPRIVEITIENKEEEEALNHMCICQSDDCDHKIETCHRAQEMGATVMRIFKSVK